MQGYTSFAVVILTHHLMVCLGTRNFTIVLGLIYFTSLLMFFPVTTLLNENMFGSATYMQVLPTVYGGGGLFYLTLLLCLSMIMLPLYALKAYEMVMKAPEYY